MFQEMKDLKHVNHSRKIFDLYIPQTQGFHSAIIASGLVRLFGTGYDTISTGVQGVFVER